MRKALLASVLAIFGLGILGCTPAPSNQTPAPAGETQTPAPAANEAKKDAPAEQKKADVKEAPKAAPAGTTATGQ